MTQPLSLLAAALLLLNGACTVLGVSAGDDPRLRNACSQDDECDEDSTCRDGLCQTLDGELESLLITAAPPSNSLLPHFTYVAHLDNVPTSGGSRDIEIPAPSQIIGSLKLPVSMSCYPAFESDDGQKLLPAIDGTVPVMATLSMRQRALGLSQQVYYAKTGAAVGSGYRFRTQVPAGEYDVYLAPPKRQSGVDCVAPPQLYRNFPIGGNDNEEFNAAISFKLAVISKLKLRVLWPQASQSLDGWLADIIEPLGGNVISTEVTLQNATPRERNLLDYSVPLAFSTVFVGEARRPDPSGLLRLRPPPGLIAPTIYLDRAAIGLLQTDPDDELELTAFSRFPSAVDVHGQLLKQQGGSSVAGAVTFISTEIYGVDSGVFAAYRTTVQAEADGLIDVTLPPGKYRVYGQPLLWSDAPVDAAPLSAAETTWDIAPDLPIQFGKVLELPPFTELGGHSRVPGAEVRAVPSPRTSSAFESAFGAAPLYPRASSGLVDDQGRFSLQLDPGRFDVTLKAPDELGFAWHVRPGVDVSNRDLELSVELRRPSVLSGRATMSLQGGTQPLASASIRAYAYLNKDLGYTRDPQQATSVVQVAETRASSDGAFRLLLPDRILPAPPRP